MLKRLPLLLPVFFAAFNSYAQTFGGNPPSVKWHQINTTAARVIFPKGMDSVAQRVAATINYINGFVKPTIGVKQKQVNIVLQNQTTIANGYVGLAPFRSEFYLTPEQNSFEVGSLPWAQQLAIHEFRHVQQYNNFNVGFSHVLKIFFGEGGQALGNAITVPDWFFEGDAVYNETLVSPQGRGRLPYFFNGFRGLWAAGKDYSWMKLRNGSYIDYTPNHYPLGYMMTAYGREQYGDNFWRKVTHDAAAFNGVFYPLQKAIKHYSGKDYRAFRNDALESFKMRFNADKATLVKNKDQHFIADEEYPAYADDNTLIYLKTTYDKVARFVVKTGNIEKTIAVKGISNDDHFSYRNGKLIYAAYRLDARWGYRNYNELVVVDVNTGREHRLTRKTKYFSPAFNADASTIVAVNVPVSGVSALHLLNTDGKLLSAIPNPGGLFYTYPQFYGNKIVSAVRDKKGQMSVAIIDSKSGQADYLLPFSFEPIGFIKVDGDNAYFTKTSGLNDQLYLVDINTKKVYGIETNAASIGAYQPAIQNGKLAWTGFTAFGYKLHEAKLNDLQKKEIINSSGTLSNIGVTGLDKGSAANILADVEPRNYRVGNYSKAHGLFNFHSLIPRLNDPNYSVELAGENILNTFQSSVLFNYNRDEGYKEIGYEGVYGGLYPYILGGFDYTFDRRGYYQGGNVYYNETSVHAGARVPLNLSAGGHYTSLSFGSNVYYSQSNFQQPYRSMFRDGHYTYLSSTISLSNQVQQARKNINPRFAQSISINYKNTIEGLTARKLLTTGALYLPGLSVNHSLVLSGAYQHADQSNGIGFSNDFPFSKGYTAESLDKMQKFGASYHFPISYPDAGFGNLYYLMRIRGNLFYDYTHATANSFYQNGAALKANFRSVGGGLFFDGKIFNEGSVSFGIRYVRLLDDDLFGGGGRDRIEVVLPVSLF